MQHESLKSSLSESQNAGDEKVKFSKIEPEHVRRIVRQLDGDLFRKYFADAVYAKFAKDCEADRHRMAALFHQVCRVADAHSPGRVIYAAWKKRDGPGGLQLADIDEDFARQLLRNVAQSQRNQERPPPNPFQRPESCELSPDEIQRQLQLKAANLSTIREMQRHAVSS